MKVVGLGIPGWRSLLVLAVSSVAVAADTDGVQRIRMGATTSLVSAQVNENDARAAIKTWADTFSRETGVRIEYLPEVMSTPERLYQSVRQGQLDAFSATTAEYLEVASYADPAILLVDQSYVAGGEEYLILVHADSGIQRLADLRGRVLLRYSSIVMSLAPDWLETQLAAGGLAPSDTFFGDISSVAKISKVVLPVFFRQADACIVNRRAFETMGEMNPQLLVKLRILAVSTKLIPVVVALSKNSTAQQKEKFKLAMTGLGNTPAGRQILALFGSRSIMAVDSSVLGPSIELITAANRLRARRAAARK